VTHILISGVTQRCYAEIISIGRSPHIIHTVLDALKLHYPLLIIPIFLLIKPARKSPYIAADNEDLTPFSSYANIWYAETAFRIIYDEKWNGK
jgi:hypothetical protein